MELSDLEEAISLYVGRAAEKLRRQYSYADSVTVFINTSRFNVPRDNYANAFRILLPTQTDSTVVLTKAAIWGLRKIYRRGYKYQKAGVMLSGFVDTQTKQADLFGLIPKGYVSHGLMVAVDSINHRMRQDTIRLASEGFIKAWSIGRGNMSQNFTTEWDELLIVN